MNIGIDIDGVMTDVLAYIKEKGQIFLNKPIVNEEGFDVADIFDVSKEVEDAFWSEYYGDYIKTVQARKGVGEVTQKLKSEGNKIFVITSRYVKPSYGFNSKEEHYKITEEFLNKNGIYYDELLYAKQPKVKEANEKEIDIFIDDSPTNIMALSKVTRVFIMDEPYNRTSYAKGAVRVHDWQEIYSEIQKIKGEEGK